MFEKMNENLEAPEGAVPRKGGAVMIIVIVMVGMLLFLGLFFFSFVASNLNSATWFATDVNTNDEQDYFGFALQQVIVGPPDYLKNSALAGRKRSILANAVGSIGPDLRPDDLHLFNGRGVGVVYENNDDGLPDSTDPLNGGFLFDYDGDGVGDSRVINFSPAANPRGGNLIPSSPLGDSSHPNFVSDFEPDAGYTYPDINSLFLGYFAFIDTNPAAGTTNLARVWIPSFHRPQYLPRNQGAGSLTDIYTDPTYANQVLRPHKEHRVLLRRYDSTAGQTVFSSQKRFMAAGDSFDTTYTGVTGPLNPFPFPDFSANEYSAGIWTHGIAGDPGIQYDVDADSIAENGNEAILMDLDHPVEILPDGTRRMPIFAITIMDADGLINLNTAGNLYGEHDSMVHNRAINLTGDPFGDSHFVSQSNMGLSPGEINPARAFYRPLPAASAGQTLPPLSMYYDEMFSFDADTLSSGDQVTQLDMANMELARLLVGVADGDIVTDADRVPGRWGEISLLETAMNGANDAPAPARPRTDWESSTPFPVPGRTARDDDDDWLIGGGKFRPANNPKLQDDVFGELGITIPPVVHPIDEIGVSLDYTPLPATAANLPYSYSSHARYPKDPANQSSNIGPTNPPRLFLTESILTDIDQATPVEYGRLRMAGRPFSDEGTAINPSIWPQYSDQWELQVPDRIGDKDGSNYDETLTLVDTYGVKPYTYAYDDYADFADDPTTANYGALQATEHPLSAGQENLFLVDEAGEVVIDPEFRNYDNDGVFSVAEMQFLHMSDGDWSKVSSGGGFSSRLQDLVEFNFDRTFDLTTSLPYDDGLVLRSQFTTDSWDRWEFSFAPAVGAVLDPTDSDYSTTRGWEFSPVDGDNQRLAFPPEFNGANRFSPNDPFRPETRQWLTIELNRDRSFQGFDLPQRKLNINRLLDKDGLGKFRFRHLTPHPVFTTGEADSAGVLDNIYGADTVVRIYNTANNVVYENYPSLPPGIGFAGMRSDKFVQEWWARYDRQCLARDIYCLLYTLGSGIDNGDASRFQVSDSGSFADPDNPYPVIVGETDNEDLDLDGNPDGDGVNDNLQAMAQFAVNYVDALDRDSVSTEFVYDIDLSDGWGITGEKVATSGDFVDTGSGSQTRSVFGVEAQQLTLSETYWVRTAIEGADSNKTPWDDTSEQDYLFIELRNASPFDVSTAEGTWRIRRIVGEDDYNTQDSMDETDKFIEFTRDVYPIRPGANFIIQLCTDTAVPNACLYVDEDGAGTITPVCPSFNDPDVAHTNWTDPRHHLDINDSNHYSYYKGDATSGDASDFFDSLTDDNFELVLERRVNMQSADALISSREDVNPWVPVDYMQVRRTSTVDVLEDTGTNNFIQTAFQSQSSFERPQPFQRFPRTSTNTNTHPGASAAPYRNHSIGMIDSSENPQNYPGAALDVPYVDKNTNCPRIFDGPNPGIETDDVYSFTIWQPHFDRDFSSVMELLSVPIVGPDKLTEKLASGSEMDGKSSAFAKFAVTDPGTGTSGDRLPNDDNRWYRILGLLEVMTGAQQEVRDSLNNLRTPGKININTLRHPGVLAALIDDDFHLGSFPNPSTVTGDSDNAKSHYPYDQLREPGTLTNIPGTHNVNRESARHWFEQFLFSRDRVDPYLNVPLPGIPGSRPFRPFHYLNVYNGSDGNIQRDAYASVEHTLLRSLPFNSSAPVTENNSRTGIPGLTDATNWGDRTVDEANIDTGLDEAIERRRLFEARTARDRSVHAVDYHTRHRLLAKMANNMTVRSNVFYCWIHVQFHEAAEDQYGNVQIGGPLDPTAHPNRRAFFVIDRSRLEEAWDPRSQNYDWRKLVTFSRLLD